MKSFLCAALATLVASQGQLKGNVDAVYELLDRTLPGARDHFVLEISPSDLCDHGCFKLDDLDDGRLHIRATGANELSYGIGTYLREHCNMTIGWPRGGGSTLFIPESWPKVGDYSPTTMRNTPWSYFMNVCTHSYSLVWYTWEDWEKFIDWMALSGINNVLAMTGQEEIQYKVYKKFGLDDLAIRSWFNGPALLTWSRGQNEYGSNIAGPLPRSWMKDQWDLQRKILPRYRSLGIVGQLPGFQGNAPVGLKSIQKDANMTDNKKGTAWLDSLDPLFGQMADEWMKIMIEDFGTDHWYQLDGYFNGVTAPWLAAKMQEQEGGDSCVFSDEMDDTYVGGCSKDCKSFHSLEEAQAACSDEHTCGGVTLTGGSYELRAGSTGLPSPTHEKSWLLTNPRSAQCPQTLCEFSEELDDSYVADCSLSCKTFDNLADAQSACIDEYSCGGVTKTAKGYELRADNEAKSSPVHEKSWILTNAKTKACHSQEPILPDPTWMRRGAAAYGGLNRTDPEAIWSFQGWAFVGWKSDEQGSALRGFIEATPKGKFNVIDMSTNGEGEWRKWREASYWGANYIWTTLHDFGGTDGMKGNLAQINQIPFNGLGNSSVWGTGFTPEGIDQNPVYYEFIIDQNWRNEAVADITDNVAKRSHRRYGLTQTKQGVADAWSLLVDSAYAQDLSVQDNTGVKKFPGSASQFENDRRTPTPTLCKIFQAWEKLVDVADDGEKLAATSAPFRYDLVNLGRELLAQLTTPASMNFSDATGASTLDQDLLTTTGQLYAEILDDIDKLVATEPAFLLGPWIRDARKWGRNNTGDCVADGYDVISNCADFYEWNARVQVTTWNPTPKGASQIPGGPIDYAGKHWSGLISDYYAARARLILQQALSDAKAGRSFDSSASNRLRAELAYNWTTATNAYPEDAQGDALAVSKATLSKYRPYYESCSQTFFV